MFDVMERLWSFMWMYNQGATLQSQMYEYDTKTNNIE